MRASLIALVTLFAFIGGLGSAEATRAASPRDLGRGRQGSVIDPLERQRGSEFARGGEADPARSAPRRSELTRAWSNRYRVGAGPRARSSVAGRGPMAGVSLYARTHSAPQSILALVGGSQSRGVAASSLRLRILRKAPSDRPVFGFRAFERGVGSSSEGRIFTFLARR